MLKRRTQSSVDVDFAFCTSLEANALHGKYSAVRLLYDFTKIKSLNAKVSGKIKHVYCRCAKDTDVAGTLLPSVAAWWIGSKI